MLTLLRTATSQRSAISRLKRWLVSGSSASQRLLSLARRGSHRICPLCDWRGRQFAPGGDRDKRRLDCICPECGSMERQRLGFMVASGMVTLDFTRVLHVAPEKSVEQWLRRRASKYLSVDIKNPAMLRMDITSLALNDDSVSLIWCSHVLEHVRADTTAIREFHRVLSPGGAAVIQVPIWRQRTYEDVTKTTAADRLEAFYQTDHVRLYGFDIVDRFEEIGFSAEVFRAQDFGPGSLLIHGLSFASTDEVFIFTKSP